MEYGYTQKDLFVEPNNYMYPKYLGKEFLTAWQTSRVDFIYTLLNKGLLVDNTVLKIFNSGVFRLNTLMELFPDVETSAGPCDFSDKTEEILACLCNSPDVILNECVLIKAYIRRFEISKKLPFVTNLPNCSIADAPLNSMNAYAEFAWILSFFCLFQFDLRTLNCLIKVNDLLCSQKAEQYCTEGALRLASSVAAELCIINDLLGIEGR